MNEKEGFMCNCIPQLENLTSADCYNGEGDDSVSLTKYCTWRSSGSNNIT